MTSVVPGPDAGRGAGPRSPLPDPAAEAGGDIPRTGAAAPQAQSRSQYGGDIGGSGQRFMPDFLTDLFSNPLDAGYADAAHRRATGPPPGPARQATARAVRLIVLALTGFLFAVAYQHVIADKPGENKTRDKLVSDIQARRGEDADLQRRVDALRSDVARARDAALGGGEAQRLRDQEVDAGLAKVRGDGAEVKLTDAPAPVDPVTGTAASDNLGRVLDRDLQDVANELWRDGAEAIAVNGERLSATSTIRQAGGAILVDFQPVTGPYKVTAIGPSAMAGRFTASATGKRFGRYVAAYHMGFSVRSVNGVTLAGATEPMIEAARPSGRPTAGTSPAPGAGSPGGPASGNTGTSGSPTPPVAGTGSPSLPSSPGGR